MRLNNLTERKPLNANEWAKYEELTTKELDAYFNFISGLVDKDEIKSKIEENYNSLECFVIDTYKTIIPRILNGKDRSFQMKYRAVAFVHKQEVGRDKTDELTQGLAYRIDDKNLGVKYHELNHALSNEKRFRQIDKNIYKSGLKLEEYSETDDKMHDLTGNLLNEGITDALAKYYNDKMPNSIPYTSAYNGVCKMMTIMLGKDLSNKKLINAYFGETQDFGKFVNHFNSVMQNENITFNELSLIDFDANKSLNGFNLNNEELILIACKYRINQAESEEQLLEEYDFIKSFDLSENNKSVLQNLFQQQLEKIQSRVPEEKQE